MSFQTDLTGILLWDMEARAMAFITFKDLTLALSYISINGIFLYCFIWSILFKVNLGLPGGTDRYFLVADALQNLKWLSLFGLGATWTFGFMASRKFESRIVRWILKGTIIVTTLLLFIFIFSPSY